MNSVDLHEVKPAHYAIHERLENWARCIRVGHGRGSVLPMFRFYKPYLVGRPPVGEFVLDTLDAARIETEVGQLPEKHAFALRWAYVFPWRDERKVCRLLALQPVDLLEMLENGRSMIKNRLTHLTTVP